MGASRRAAVRLLPVGPDHGRCGAAFEESQADRRRYRRGNDEHLPLRHVSAHPRRGAPRSRNAGEGGRMKLANPARRRFIVGSAVAGGGLALGVPLEPARAQDVGAEVHAWVVVKPDDTCVIRIARSEMGQGTRTGLAQLVAEELECDWKKLVTESITPGQNLARKRVWGEMSTGGSRGIRTSHDYVRRGGAAARMMLLQAAADEWKVPVAEISVASGVITHRGSGRRTTYGKVAAAAARLTPPDPKSITLKNPKDWKIAGQPVKR